MNPDQSGTSSKATAQVLSHRPRTPRSNIGADYTSQIMLCPLYEDKKTLNLNKFLIIYEVINYKIKLAAKYHI